MTEPHVSHQIPPSPSASPEPPRKRPRTSERELGPSPSPHQISSPSSSQGEASGSGSSYLGASTGRQGGSFPDEAASDDRSGVRRTPDGMKAGGLKGKGTERPSAPETQDTEMVWQPEGGATSSAMAVLYPRHGEQADHGEDEDEDAPVRDGEFYIDSADCVIRVEDTLFRVHRYFLGRDSSAFQHMFSMPMDNVPPENTEGCSDKNPIRLYGESAERFRALLSVIYDLPLQLQTYNTPAADVERLLTIAEMTNKYHFASIETWAVDALYNVISGLHGPPQKQYQLGSCSSTWMKRLLEVALLCGHEPLRNYVADKWVERIRKRNLRPVHALDIADRSRMRRLQGYAYYVQLLEMGDGFDPGVTEDGEQYARSRLGATATALAAVNASADSMGDRLGTPAVLSHEQKQRLLSGHWSLTRLWEQLRVSAPKFQRPDGCTYHQHGCLQTWATVWKDVGKTETTLRFPPVDVLGRLEAMREQLYMHADLSCALTPQCKRTALDALKVTVKEVQEGLADHFADLVAAEPAGGRSARAGESSL
ncbi:hypothetical protein K466DRAFT_586332 [Polyporus arcularius HHB13444]|uniref:BTB domain-containing protein n=1 Tax=Polyporus arcularius HHB13444 TaxID=1314778 RepID=A0A5C3PE00_9APHY|nr:hypothetical protein K466DRAFT_586332 [Polyporus arcularius HHB13444]